MRLQRAVVGMDFSAPATAAAPPPHAPSDELAAVGAALSTHPYAHRSVAASAEVIRVLLVDDHAVVRAGVRAMLTAVPDMDIVGEAANGADAVTLASRLAPQVVVMDLEMPGGDGESATRALAALSRPPRILILTMHEERERLLPLLRAGAAGYLAKNASHRDLIEAIRVVAAGDTYVRPAVARRLASHETRTTTGAHSACDLYNTLSEREQIVLRLAAQGLNGPEIGRQLAISTKTVNTYKHRIRSKIGLGTRAEYVRLAIEAHLFDE